MSSTPAPTTGLLTMLVTQLLAFNASRLGAYQEVYGTEGSDSALHIDERRHKLRDFLTVAIAAVRQSGKTHSMIELVGPNDLVVFHNDVVRRLTHERYMNVRGSALPPSERASISHFVTAHSIKHLWQKAKEDANPDPALRNIDMKTLRRVWVDDATFIFDEIIDRKRFYRWLAKNTQGDLETIMLG